MKIQFILLSILFCNIIALAQDIDNGTNRFDSNWSFFRGGALGAENTNFDDSKWRVLDLPHDWSIEDMPGTSSPFGSDAISQISGGFTTGGTGWYRKTFVLDEKLSKKRVVIQFDGVYMNSEVWINGASLGSHPYGYTSFWFDITDFVKFDAPNVLAVKVRNEGENSRWYSGSGIYRHVWLKVLESIHIAQWGTSITTPDVNDVSAKVNVRTTINNQSNNSLNVKLVTRILNSIGEESAQTESAQTIEKGGTLEFNQDVAVQKPNLWSTELPTLYTAISEVYTNDQLTDRTESKFGIRKINFDVINGFQLNGKTIKLKGGCVHHDNGPLGAKSYDRAEERRVELLKASGFNAIRCSHNPPAPAFLDACDRLGMLVIEEAFDMWADGKNSNDYHLWFENWWQKDIKNMVLRDRNHPSIIMWSIGNEILNMTSPEVVKKSQMLGDFIRKIEPSRPITSALNGLHPDKDPFLNTLDIAGYNYAVGGDHLQTDKYLQDHSRIPDRIMYGSESYALEAFGSWMAVDDFPYVIGDFVWTAFDHIGEASIGWRGYPQEKSFYPWNLAWVGDIDICGWKRPQSYYRDALWKVNQLSIFVKPPKPSFEENPNRIFWSKWHWPNVLSDWNWLGYENTPLEVSVYSSCEVVELFLNNKTLGKKETNRKSEFKAMWKVPYMDGELKAIGYQNGKHVNTAILQTANKPTQIQLTTDRNILKADGQDLSYVTVEITDAKGNKHPKADNLVNFKIEGPGEIIAVGNANPVSLESYQQPHRKAWQGKCMVVIKSEKQTGNVVLTATSAKLKSAIIKIEVK